MAAGHSQGEESGDASVGVQRSRSRTRSLAESATPWKLRDVHPINLLHIDLPDATEHSTRFAEHSLKVVFFSMAILTTAVAVFNYLHLSFGWTVASLAIAVFSVRSRIESLRESFHGDVERRRTEGHEHEAESVEWVNGFVRQIWPLIDPNLFTVLVDLLHQFLEEHAPSIVTAARVSRLDIGTNAMRLLSFRLLPHDAQVGDSTSPNHTAGDQGLDHVNLEVDFLYSVPPPGAEKLRNIRFMIHLNFGVKKAAFEVPVNVKVTHISGKLRLRLSLTSDPPFVTHTQVSFPFMPHLRISARPMKSVNVMNLPGISHYILNSLKDVFKVFVMPNSWTLDVSRFLMNSEIQLAPQNQGAIVLRIGKLNAEPEGDSQELLYVSIELSTSAKPAYQSRTLARNAQELVFGETAFVVVPRDTLLPDRCLDTIVIPLEQLVNAPDAHQEGNSELASHFHLQWSAAYFGIASAARPAGVNAESRAALYAQRIQEMLDSAVAPPADLETGLFAVQIHSVVNVDVDPFICAVFLNGQLKAKTQLLNTDYVNKTIEVLCLDRHHSVVTVAILDAQSHLKAAISLRLSTLFAYRSQATRWYNMASTETAEEGRVRLSTLFKALAIHLPPPLLSPDLGVVYVRSISAWNIEQFFGRIRFRLSSSTFSAFTPEASSRPADASDRIRTNMHEIEWDVDEDIPIPVTSRQQSTLIIELVPEDMDGSATYTACYHLSSLGETDEQQVKSLLLHPSLNKAQISRSLSDFALNKLHPSPTKKKKPSSPDQVSRESSPIRMSTQQPQIRVELRFEGGTSRHFLQLAETCPTQASMDAALGFEASQLAEMMPEVNKPGAPPSREKMSWGDIDMPRNEARSGRQMESTESVDSKTTPIKKGPKSWMKSIAGKSKKDKMS